MTTAPRMQASDEPDAATGQLIASYRSGLLSRREFFQKLAFATGSILLAYQIVRAEGIASEEKIYNWPHPQGQSPTPKESIAAL